MDEKRVALVLMDEQDFGQLYTTSMRWAGGGWEKHAGWLVPIRDGEEINWKFKFMYEMERWADVLLARAFLGVMEHGYQVLSDEKAGHYLLITDYPANWEKKAGDDGLIMYASWPLVDEPDHTAGSLSFTMGEMFAGREREFDLPAVFEAFRGAINEQLKPYGIVLRDDGAGRVFDGPFPVPMNSDKLIVDAYKKAAKSFPDIAEKHRKK